MRITGGKLGGRRLVAPTERRPAKVGGREAPEPVLLAAARQSNKDTRVRPTSDRTRQAIFNMLLHRDFGIGFSLENAAVLDLFAGTGALGIEALSQGARWCLMVDDDADSRALQRQNVEALGLTGVTKIWRRDATDLGPLGPGAGGPFDLVFLDPPYAKNLIPLSLKSLKDGGWLAANALIVAETSADEIIDAPGFTLIEERDYGETRVRFLALQCHGPPESGGP